VVIPDHPRLIRELRLLERKCHTGSRDSVDHGRLGSDDYANSLFGMLSLASKPKPRAVTLTAVNGDLTGAYRQLDTDPPPRSRIMFRNFDMAGNLLRERRGSS
jgi:hypothetical protein